MVFAGLIVNEHFDKVDVVVVNDGAPAMLEESARLWRNGRVKWVAIVDSDQFRAVRLGAVPSLAEISVPGLVERGVSSDSILVVPGRGYSLGESVANAVDWVESRDVRRALFLCPKSRGRYVRWSVDRQVDDSGERQIFVQGIPHINFDEQFWWHRAAGFRCVADAYFRLIFLLTRGSDDRPSSVEWDPDDFERSLGLSPG